ncbi:MAG TPA: DUF3108 domain-containing protein [Sphingobacterium sp.]|nr:DUF3108 domain-containing protein [Sphingobacterium sp.]
MKKLYILIALLISWGSTFAQNLPYLSESTFKEGEKLTYKLRYGKMSAATGVLSVNASKLQFSQPTYHLNAYGQTSSFFSMFFTVRNKYDSYISQNTFLPFLYLEDIKEGNYTRKEYATFDHRNKTVKGQKGTFKSPVAQTFDLLSAYYFARNLDFSSLKPGDTFKLTYFLNDEIEQLGIQYIGVEKIKTNLGTIECIKLSPEIKPGRIFKKDSRLYLWVTNDGNRIPVRAHVDILIGSVSLELDKAEGLKHELGKKVSYSK